MKKKIPIGYYVYLVLSIILTYIFWSHYHNNFLISLAIGFFLGIPGTYIIIVVHAIIEKMK